MADLFAAVAIIMLTSIGVFFLMLWGTQKGPRWICDALAGIAIFGLIYYTFYVWNEPIIARLVPYSSLIVLGNWYPIFAGFIAATVWNRVPGQASRKALFVAALGLSAFYSLVRPLQGLPPECDDRWAMGVICLQSSPATCSPACAATLLGMHQIPATESEMAELCLTRKGTNWKGLYRGLKLKTADEIWDPVFFRCTYEELKAMPPAPRILTVEFRSGMEGQLSEGASRGWLPGVSHSIVLVSFQTDGSISVADPTTGIETWTESDMQLLWQGEGMRLVDNKE